MASTYPAINVNQAISARKQFYICNSFQVTSNFPLNGKVVKSKKVGITHLDIAVDTQVTHHVVAMGSVADYHILTKCSKCNTCDLVQHFMSFDALKLF